MAKDKFTVEEVNSILDSTLKQTGSGPVQYVGARYVPIFATPHGLLRINTSR